MADNNERRTGHYPHMASPVVHSMQDRFRSAHGLPADEKVDSIETPAFVGRGKRHARMDIYADEHPTADERAVRDNADTVDRLTKDSPNYGVSPLMRSTRPQIARDLFASPKEIAQKRGHTIESTQGANMPQDIDALIEGAFTNWMSSKIKPLAQFAKRQRQDLNASPKDPDTFDRASFVKNAVAGGPKSAYAMLDPVKSPEVPSLLRKDLQGVIGPYRPFGPSGGSFKSHQVKRSDGGLRTVSPRTPGTFTDNETGLVHSKTGKTVDVTGVKDPSGIEVPIDPSKRSGARNLNPYRPFQKVSRETSDAAAQQAAARTKMYREGPYRGSALRVESVEQTERRIIAEVRTAIKSNVKGGEMANDASPEILNAVNARMRSKVVESFVQDLVEAPDGAAGAGSTVNRTAFDQLTRSPGGNGKMGYPDPMHPNTPMGQQALHDTDRPTLLRKAALGDAGAAETIKGINAQVDAPDTSKTAGYNDAQYKPGMTDHKLLQAGYIKTGPYAKSK